MIKFKAWNARPLIDILSPRHWHFPVLRNTRIEILILRLVPKDKLINPLRSLRLCESLFTRLAKRSRIPYCRID